MNANLSVGRVDILSNLAIGRPPKKGLPRAALAMFDGAWSLLLDDGLITPNGAITAAGLAAIGKPLPYPAPPEALAVLDADPPWQFDDDLPGDARGAKKIYRNTMSVDEICAFQIPPMLPDSVLYLWRVSSQVEAGYKVCRAWGFEPKTEGVWAKREPCAKCKATGRVLFKNGTPSLETCRNCAGFGDRPANGMGHKERGSHEAYIIAVRGSPKRNDTKAARSVKSLFEARMPCHPGTFEPKHSAKPVEMLERIETLWPGPYGELFARSQRPGWWAYGNELEGAK